MMTLTPRDILPTPLHNPYRTSQYQKMNLDMRTLNPYPLNPLPRTRLHIHLLVRQIERTQNIPIAPLRRTPTLNPNLPYRHDTTIPHQPQSSQVPARYGKQPLNRQPTGKRSRYPEPYNPPDLKKVAMWSIILHMPPVRGGIIPDRIVKGVKSLGRRPQRGRLAEYLWFIVNGARIRTLFDSAYIRQRQGIPYYGQCRYRWTLCTALGVITLQRTARGQWSIEVNWIRLYELAALGGYDQPYSKFLKELGVPAHPHAYVPSETDIAQATAAFLHLYPAHPHHATYQQVRRAIQHIYHTDGPEGIEQLLTATTRLAKQMKTQHRRTAGNAGEGTRYTPNPLTYIYSRRWERAHEIEPARIRRATPAAPPPATPASTDAPPPNTHAPPEPNAHELIRDALRTLYQHEPHDATVDALARQPFLSGMLLGDPSRFRRRFPTPDTLPQG